MCLFEDYTRMAALEDHKTKMAALEDHNTKMAPFQDHDHRLTVVVSNIHPKFHRSQAKKLFSEFGEVSELYMPQGDEPKMHKGIAYVRYTDEASCDNAVGQLDGLPFGPSKKSIMNLCVDYFSPHDTLDQLAAQIRTGLSIGDEHSASILKKDDHHTTTTKSVKFQVDDLEDVKERESYPRPYFRGHGSLLAQLETKNT